MFSRAPLLAGKNGRSLLLLTRSTNSACSAGGQSGDGQDSKRPVRAEFGGKVRMGFIPDEWFQMFYKKTGVTGPYMFGVGVSTYLFSKEIYVMEHEYYTGLSILIMIVMAMKKFGPTIGTYLDKEIDAVEKEWKDSRSVSIKAYEDAIKAEKKEQDSAEGQKMLMAAKKENIALQLEAAFRERAMTAYREVKKRLDYQVERQNVERRINQKNMVDWVVRQVMKSITPDQEKATLQKCIADLDALARSIPKGK